MANLETNLGRLKLRNPVLTASGTFGYGAEYSAFFPIEKLGAVVVKGISSFPWQGNPSPRVAEVRGGLINSIGLQNPGVEKFISGAEYLPALVKCNATVIVNIWGRTIDEYVSVASRLDEKSDKIAALEINISCPNIKAGGLSFGTDLKSAEKVVSAIRKAVKMPLITKLSPNVTSIADFAKCVEGAGTDIVSLINTLPAMSIDIETRKPRIANITGGLSGPGIRPVAVKMVYDAARAVEIPVIGMGGICTAEDAIEFFLAGADAVAVGTAIFADPCLPLEIISGIQSYLDSHGIRSIADIVGKVEI